VLGVSNLLSFLNVLTVDDLSKLFLESFERDGKFISYDSPMLVAGIVVFALVVFCGMEFGGGHFWRRSREELPLLAPRDDPTMPGHATNDLPGVAVSTPPGESAPYGESARDDQQLCTICLDAPKDCFFDPCGHRCTCYSCGRRSVSLLNHLAIEPEIGYLRKDLVCLFGCMVTLCLPRYVLQTM
jgi:hypothetical protein